MRKTSLWPLILVLVIIAAVLFVRHDGEELVPERDGTLAATTTAEVVAEDLDIPWEIAFLPDGDMLVTERPGRLVRISEERTVIPIAGVAHRGEGGLLGM
ncbi:MAG TPA: PQQ-dependent sugar dehydrogenase, partial [Candidatus Paceibacterota bacterium]|nr:PQQ-dependent sugar dehydrogenase [Candidatus Paceibacterota bacterium]